VTGDVYTAKRFHIGMVSGRANAVRVSYLEPWVPVASKGALLWLRSGDHLISFRRNTAHPAKYAEPGDSITVVEVVMSPKALRFVEKELRSR
jgi:hypothetical protein